MQSPQVHLRTVADVTSCLRVLDVSGCADGVTNTALRLFLEHNPGLEHLNISKCYEPTESGNTDPGLADNQSRDLSPK